MEPQNIANKSTLQDILHHCMTATVTALAMPPGSLSAHITAERSRSAAEGIMVVTASLAEAEIFHRELIFYGVEEPVLLPPWDVSAFTAGTSSPDYGHERIKALFALHSNPRSVLVVPVETLLQKLPPRTALFHNAVHLEAGQEIEIEDICNALVGQGYCSVDIVDEPGCFARRGGLLDIFPVHNHLPVRMDFYGDTIESIKTFDPITQRSLTSCEHLTLLPSREVAVTPAILAELAKTIKRRADELDIPADIRRQFIAELQALDTPLRIDLVGGLLFPRLCTVFDYQPSPFLVVVAPDQCLEAAYVWHSAAHEQHQRALDEKTIVPAFDSVISEIETLSKQLHAYPRLELRHQRGPDDHLLHIAAQATSSYKIPTHGEHSHQFAPFAHQASSWLARGGSLYIGCHNRTQEERLETLLATHGLPFQHAQALSTARTSNDTIVLVTGDLTRGFILEHEKILVLAEEELFGSRTRRKSGVSALKKKQILASLAEMRPGDPMVHLEHGIGIYRGLQHLKTGAYEGDFLLLDYAGNDKLYVPVDRLGLVQRYTGGDGSNPAPARLGTVTWHKTKTKAKKNIEELAHELLQIYAKRQASQGFPFSPPDALFREFEATFPWEETPDQLNAINDVLMDMQHERPMDRLVCGDVGYGKTEVALRAAFKAVLDGKQVAVLVPTTILAQQHFETFKTRMEGYPLTVDMLSRFRSAKEQKTTLGQLRQGAVDIIIGTQRLLQKDVQFKDLGLLIIDEEQRFGVKDKEKLKQFRATVDILTLTATPIPRTLHLSMLGIRDLSIIMTPPVDRHAIKTFVTQDDDQLLVKAITHELTRGGQVFYVHNRVQTIERTAERIKGLVPTASVQVAHGQMHEDQLEKIMLSFMHGETDILVTTTIIESGLDIPRANTMIVDRADQFGLSQLYQLRGRIGRSSVQSYAYLLTPGLTRVTSEARERLKVIQDISELGAGFRIASHDLELRGAGDMLGARQSGTVADIGFELYTQMLEETIAELNGKPAQDHWEPEIHLPVPAFLPDNYINNMNQRLILYKRFVQAESAEDIDDIMDEIQDRFGTTPTPVRLLKAVMLIRLTMRMLRIEKLEMKALSGIITFRPDTSVEPTHIITKVRTAPQSYRFTAEHQLHFKLREGLTDPELLSAMHHELVSLQA